MPESQLDEVAAQLHALRDLARESRIALNATREEAEHDHESLSRGLRELVDAALLSYQHGNPKGVEVAEEAGSLLSTFHTNVRSGRANEGERDLEQYRVRARWRWPSFDQLKTEYRGLFDSCTVTPEKARAVDAGLKIIVDKARRAPYDAVSAQSNVPWYVIAILHYREADGNMMGHLHNGDLLTRKTHNDPPGRPDPWNPPPQPWDPVVAWALSAADALKWDKLWGETDWSLEQTLFRIEKYNGPGFRMHGVNSGYLWCCSQHYTKGGYATDGKWDPNYRSQQIGAAVLLKALVNSGSMEIA